MVVVVKGGAHSREWMQMKAGILIYISGSIDIFIYTILLPNIFKKCLFIRQWAGISPGDRGLIVLTGDFLYLFFRLFVFKSKHKGIRQRIIRFVSPKILV